MAEERAFRVVVTFDTGVKASVWTREEPVFPVSMWEPETLSLIGDGDGPRIEFLGRDLSELRVVRSGPPAEPSGARM